MLSKRLNLIGSSDGSAHPESIMQREKTVAAASDFFGNLLNKIAAARKLPQKLSFQAAFIPQTVSQREYKGSRYAGLAKAFCFAFSDNFPVTHTERTSTTSCDLVIVCYDNNSGFLAIQLKDKIHKHITILAVKCACRFVGKQ